MPSPVRRNVIVKNPSRDEAPRRVLGANVGLGDLSSDQLVSALKDAMDSPIVSMPVLEHTTWDIGGPDTDAEIAATFGNEIDPMNSGKQVEGVDTVQTTFVHPGILQTGIIVVAVGFHVFAEPLCFTARGNSLSPAPGTTIQSPISPDVFTQTDDLESNLNVPAGSELTPALLNWGWPMQYAAWHLINGYNFNWIVRQRYHLLNESARYIAYFSSMADEMGAGTSQVNVMEFARRANARYRSKGGSGAGIFLPVSHRRVGSFANGGDEGFDAESSVFRPTSDFDLANVTWGGLGLQDRLANKVFRRLTLPYYIPANTPIGITLEQSDDIQAALMQQQLSITAGLGGSVPPVLSADPNIAASIPTLNAAAHGLTQAPELSLDATQIISSQVSNVGRAQYKGGNLSISMIVKGFEVTDDFARNLQANPDLLAAVQAEFGLQMVGG